MTPEQRAKRAVPSWLQVGREGNDREVRPWLCERVARALRAERSAALERAAKELDDRAAKVAARGRNDLAEWIRGDAEIVRMEKLPAPRRAKGPKR